MAEALSIKIGADVGQAISNIGKLNTKLDDTDAIVSDVIGTSKDLEDALDKLGKQGLLSINSLGKSIEDFKDAFANATNPEDIKKFGEALVVLKKRQQDLINAGLPEHLDKVSHSSGGSVVATQRLSASVLGLSNHLGALPPELAGLTHGFDQIIQSFERITHGTEGAGEKVTKFAGVLGEVGLGLAISVAIGLLVDFVHSLFDVEKGLGDAGQASEEFTRQIKAQNESIDDLKTSIADANALGKIRLDIQAGQALESLPDKLKALENLKFGLLDLQGISTENRGLISSLGDEEVKAADRAREAFKRFTDLSSDGVRELVGNVDNIDAALAAIKFKQPITNKNGVLIDVDATEKDKLLLEDVKSTAEQLVKIQKQSAAANSAQTLIYGQIEKQRVDIINEANKEQKRLFDSRAEIIKEFTAKFASIKDPFPDFFTKNLPLGKVEDKALRAALENAFKVFESASRDLFNTKKIDPGTIPLEIKFKPEIAGKSDLVRQIEDKFGEISKEVENAVNKGLFIVPVDFKIAPEGDGKALKELEDLKNKFISDIEGLTGQENAIFDIDAEFQAHIDITKARDAFEEARKQVALFGGDPVIVNIDAQGKVTTKIDVSKVLEIASAEIRESLKSIFTDSFSNIGNLIGDALSGVDLGNGFKQFATILSNGLAAIGKSLIAAGAKILVAKVALGKLFANPAFSIAAGVALIALSRIIANNVGNTQAREKGGSVFGGHEYLVNEKGQEAFKDAHGNVSMIKGGMQMFRPAVSGSIIPASLAKTIATSFKFPKLENGGIVNTPTFALIGEGLNPEIVAPIRDLPALMGINNSGSSNRLTAKLRGRDIYLSQSRQVRSNDRLV